MPITATDLTRRGSVGVPRKTKDEFTVESLGGDWCVEFHDCGRGLRKRGGGLIKKRSSIIY